MTRLSVIEGSGRAPQEPLAVRRDRWERKLRAHAYVLVADLENESRRRQLTLVIAELPIDQLMCLVVELDGENKRKYERLMQPGGKAS